jgi:hypothetical protein
MKDKILFWISSDLNQYFLAYSLQKQYDCELFAIIDITNKPKKFFEEQNLVNFKKIWFFHDHIKISNKHPDITYLRNVEKKYNINIWKLAINERLFYRFNDFQKFSNNEILSIDEQSCKLFETVLEEVKPDYFLTKEPGFHHLELFYEMCKNKGIIPLITSFPKLGMRCRIAKDANKLESPEQFENIKSKNRTFSELIEYRKSFDYNKQVKTLIKKQGGSKFELIKAATNYLLFSNNSNIKTHYTYFGRNKLNVIKFSIVSGLKKKYRQQFMQKKMHSHPSFEKSFVYFPLGVDNERTSLINAPFFTNQIEVIRMIAKSMPIGYELYVKETPAQETREWRSISEYKEIMDIPNVQLIHPSVSNDVLLQNCSLVITVAGSSGFDAAFFQKPAIVFSDIIYSVLPSVYRIKEIEKLPKFIKIALETKVNSSDLDRYMVQLEEECFEFDIFEFSTKYQDHFYYGGHLQDVEITQQQMSSFLDENIELIDKLAIEHIKKINQFKINNKTR